MKAKYVYGVTFGIKWLYELEVFNPSASHKLIEMINLMLAHIRKMTMNDNFQSDEEGLQSE